jgi:cytochrome c peroxidase
MPNLIGVPESAGPVENPEAKAAWEALPLATRDSVTRVFSNIGKAIAAYERRIRHTPSRFDRFADELVQTGRAPRGVLTREETAGLKLFIGKANCVNCHNGPLFTDQYFHNTGVPAVEGLPLDLGRTGGAEAVRSDEFNCWSPYSDAPAEACAALNYLVADGTDLEAAFKTPSLRNVALRAPYMDAGQLATLSDVVRHYNHAPAAAAGKSELLEPLGLSERELASLAAFLETLSAPLSMPGIGP